MRDLSALTLAHRGAEILILRLHHAPAEIRRDGFGVTTDDVVETLARAPGRAVDRFEALHDLLESGAKALEQQLFLGRDVVVNGRLRDVELVRDVIERGVVIPASRKARAAVRMTASRLRS